MRSTKAIKVKNCSTCLISDFRTLRCLECGVEHHYKNWEDRVKKEISFPILNNLTPTAESCTMKLIEELGELLRLIGKGNRQSGESEQTVGQIAEELEMNMVLEAFDVAQSAVTMAHTLCSKHGIDIDMMLRDHKEKLYERGYLK